MLIKTFENRENRLEIHYDLEDGHHTATTNFYVNDVLTNTGRYRAITKESAIARAEKFAKIELDNYSHSKPEVAPEVVEKPKKVRKKRTKKIS